MSELVKLEVGQTWTPKKGGARRILKGPSDSPGLYYTVLPTFKTKARVSSLAFREWIEKSGAILSGSP